MADYTQLVNQGGTIFNQAAKVAYQNPNQLAADLGTTANNIQWGNIAMAGADFNPTGYAGYAIPTTALTTPQLQITVPTPTLNTSGADSAMAGVKTQADYYKEATPAPTAEQTQVSDLTKQMQDLLGQTTGQTQALADEEKKRGIEEMSKQMAVYNADILRQAEEYNVLKKQYDAAYQEIGNSPQQLSAVVGTKRQELLRTQAAELNTKAAETQLTISRQAGLQGNIQAAQTAAQRAIQLKYAAVEDEIATKKAQLDVLVKSGILTKQEKAQAVALDRQYTDQQQAIADEKAKSKENLGISMSLGISNTFYRKPTGEIVETATGVGFTSPEDFQAKTGISLETAYQKGLISDVSAQTLADFDQVNQLKAKYWDAGLTGRETLEQASQIINSKSAIRRKEVSTGSGGGTQTERLLAKQQELITSAVSQLDNERRTSGDGFANPNTYRNFKQQYIAAGGTPSDFFQSFPLEVYVSPPNRKGDLLGTSAEIKQAEQTGEQNEMNILLEKSNNGQNLDNLNLQEKMKLLEYLGG